jgi:hypothetical protein
MKDGHGPNRANAKNYEARGPEAKAARFISAGFIPQSDNEWTYTWKGDFPVFTLRRGLDFSAGKPFFGLIITYDPADIKIKLPCGSRPKDIKTLLDDQIFQIMQHDAKVNNQPLNWKPAGEEIDVDNFMAGLWVSE